MCILFMYYGSNDADTDYHLVLASNRDEFYDRPALNMGPWEDDPQIYAGKDLEAGRGGGTWLALSPVQKKIGVLLNLPGSRKQDSKSRGKIAVDYVKSKAPIAQYVGVMEEYMMDCNEFNFIAIELGKKTPEIYNYSNATCKLKQWNDKYLGFSNSLPEIPLKKVEFGKKKLEVIMKKYGKKENKKALIDEVVKLLKCEERCLPDPELERRRPEIYQELSSIFVTSPSRKYGTRAHSIILVAKTGEVDFIEISLKSPIIDPATDKWEINQFNFNLVC